MNGCRSTWPATSASVKPSPEADEQIEVIRMPLSEALALASANKIHDGKTLIALMLYDRLRRENCL